MRLVWSVTFALFLLTSISVAQDDYRLGAEDVVRISIAGYEQLSVARAAVSALGTVTLPVLGELKVQGQTPAEAESMVAQVLTRYVKGNPAVQVSVVEINSRKVRILGAVKVPGEYKLEQSAILVDIIALAGDVLEDADMTAIQIISADGTQQQVDLRSYFRTGDASSIPPLKPDDTIRVPKRRSLSGSPMLLDAPDSTESMINVWGSVPTPGQYVFYGTPTLLEVLSRAGGVREDLALKRIQIIRGDPHTGGQITVDMQAFMASGEYDMLPALQSGDTVFVPDVRRMDRLKQSEVVVMGEVNSPGSYPIDGPVPIADALALASGITREADPGKVRISREQNGVLQHRDTDVRPLLSGYSHQTDLSMLPVIQPGDTVFVSSKKNGFLSAANVSRGLIAFFVDMVALYGLYQVLTK